jgi:hypothetical protein
MIYRNVLTATGCTTDRLRKLFTSSDPKEIEIAKKWEDRIRSRMHDGVRRSVRNATIWQAVDIAMDSTPIQPETIPLLLFAQGKIKKEGLIDKLRQSELGKSCLCDSPVMDAAGKQTGTEIKIDIPRLYEMSINLIRSYTTRRLAAQTARFSNLWPYFRYEPRGVDMVSKLRADALSGRIDEMSDSYNYRHFFPQTFRHQFLYSRSVVFPRQAWSKTISWRQKEGTEVAADGKMELESYTEREGIDFVAPHISRVFWDRSAPLANINTDTGPAYIGYWDLVPFRTIKDGDGYFNRDKVTAGEELSGILKDFSTYFGYYFDENVLKWPDPKAGNPAAANERNRCSYGEDDGDKGVMIAQYFEKINPKQMGIADLNVEVWTRLGIAGDGTVVAGELLTSLPACYGGLNENDDREINASHATELMAFQDQLTNIWSQMLMNIRAGMLQIWAIDKDALEPEMLEHIKKTLKAKDYYSEPQAFFYSGEKLRSLGISNPADNPRAFLTIIQAQIQTTIQQSMEAAARVLDMADRILLFSPNETAQPNPREVAAREITEISSSTDAVKTFVSDGIDEQRAAVKRLIAESTFCESTTTFSVPIMQNYTAKTIREAGFKFTGSDRIGDGDIVPLKTPITGVARNLVYSYYYDSRDGGDRPVNSQGAQIMSVMLGQFMQVPAIAQAFGKERLFEWVNEIARMSGAAIDLKLEVEEGEETELSANPELEQRVAQIEQLLKQIAGGAPPPQQGAAPAAPTSAAAEPSADAMPPALMEPSVAA